MARPTMKVQISNGQYWIMSIALVVPMGHFIYLHLAMAFSGRNTWLSLLLASLIGVGVLYLQGVFAARFTGQSLIQWTKEALGPWIGIPVSLLFVAFFLLAGAVTLSEFELFWGMIYSLTPDYLFSLFILVIALSITYTGLEVLARTIQLLVPVLILIGLAVSILVIKDKEFVEILPFLYHGLLPVWQGTWIFLAMFSELLVLLMIAPHVKEPKKLPQQGVIMMGLFAILFLGPVTGPIMVFGEPMAKAFSYPTFAEIQYIAYTNVLERIDLLGMFLWTVGCFFRISIFLYATAASIAHVIDAPNYRLYVVPTTLLFLATALSITTSREELSAFLTIAYPEIAVGVGSLLPLVVGVVALLRLRLQNRSRNTANRPRMAGN